MSRQALGVCGNVADWDFVVIADAVVVSSSDGRGFYRSVPNYGTGVLDLMTRPTATAGWARMQDGDEVLYFYDPADGNFGYAVNIDTPDFSEWGYAPF